MTDQKLNRYLGDGLYSTHDGYQFCLQTLDGMKVFLEPKVVEAFFEFVEQTLNVEITVKKKKRGGSNE